MEPSGAPSGECVDGSRDCPVVHVDALALSRPGGLVAAAAEAFRARPGAALLKLVPTGDWRPPDASPQAVDDLRIPVPVRQHAHGARGCYTLSLEELPESKVGAFAERCGEAEHAPPAGATREWLTRAYWRELEYRHPLYGSDIPGTLFQDDLPPPHFSFSRSGCLLQAAGVSPIPGVTTPMLYCGMWRSSFAWHLEDMNLYSVNYLHAGAPKMWYGISPAHAARFDRLLAGLYPYSARQCREFARHKKCVVSVKKLQEHSIPYVTAYQRPGEFIVTAAGAYHCGFNTGYNLAEATNFATPDWLTLGRCAGWCKCTPDAVWLDVEHIASFDPKEWATKQTLPAGATRAKKPGVAPPELSSAQADESTDCPVHAVVGERDDGARYFYLGREVQRTGDQVTLEWLRESPTVPCRFSACMETWVEHADSLVSALDVKSLGQGAYLLRTPRERILSVDLMSSLPSSDSDDDECDQKPAPHGKRKAGGKEDRRGGKRRTGLSEEPVPAPTVEDADSVEPAEHEMHEAAMSRKEAKPGVLNAVAMKIAGTDGIWVGEPVYKLADGNGEAELLWLEECCDGLFRRRRSVRWSEHVACFIAVELRWRHNRRGWELVTPRDEINSVRVIQQ